MIINMGGGGVVPIKNLDATIIIPGSEDQVIPFGTYLIGDLIIAGDVNLVPENIPQGVNLFGVQGTRPFNIGVNVWNIYDEWIPTKTGNISFSTKTVEINGNHGGEIQVSSNVFSHEEITPSMLSGKTIGEYPSGSDLYYWVLTSASTWQLRSGTGHVGNNGTYTYDASTGVITLSTIYTMTLYGTTYYTVSATIPAHKGNLIAFAVSNDPSEYPNGGTDVNGLYYELLAQTSSANVMSLSNDALATVQSDYREQIETEVSQA